MQDKIICNVPFIDIDLLYSGSQQLCVDGQAYCWREPEYPKKKYIASSVHMTRFLNNFHQVRSTLTD